MGSALTVAVDETRASAAAAARNALSFVMSTPQALMCLVIVEDEAIDDAANRALLCEVGTDQLILVLPRNSLDRD